MASAHLIAQQQKAIRKYLAQYAEQEVTSLASFPVALNFQHVLVIPAFQETNTFIERFLNSALSRQQCLVIVVINQPDSDFGRENTSAQQLLAQQLTALGDIAWQQKNLRLVKPNNSASSAILLVDRYSQPLPPEQGVGLARKIGADIAVALYQQKVINSTWIHSTDADAELPDNYFTGHFPANLKQKNVVATCCNFYHHSEQQAIHQANALYESALRYYVAGLHYADSPYAYFTIGSILSFDVLAYCQARGFPKRSAGEDFYLLNKLAKLGSIEFLPNITIKLDARPSQRVPFGTGPAVKSIMELTTPTKEYQYYNPNVFLELKGCLSAFHCLWQHREQSEFWLNALTPITQQALKNIGLLSFIEKQQRASQVQFDKQLAVWFDSFKTLKFIHALRDLGLENMPLVRALEIAPFKV